jgi:predicted nucleic acid-binding protein
MPAIVYYEVKREQKSFSIARLHAFVTAFPGRYLPLSDVALRLAAELWAKCRREGRPTADAKALVIDVIIAAQIVSSNADMSQVVIATANPKHLSQFIIAKHWREILS